MMPAEQQQIKISIPSQYEEPFLTSNGQDYVRLILSGNTQMVADIVSANDFLDYSTTDRIFIQNREQTIVILVRANCVAREIIRLFNASYLEYEPQVRDSVDYDQEKHLIKRLLTNGISNHFDGTYTGTCWPRNRFSRSAPTRD